MLHTERARQGSILRASLFVAHGMISTHFAWKPVMPDLQERFTVLVMDRRGRGGAAP